MTPHNMQSQPLRDAHLHLLPLGQTLTHLNLTHTTTITQTLEAVAAEATRRATNPHPSDHPWIIASGYRVHAIQEQRFPTRAELDEAAPNTPVLINSFDLHAASVSSALLAAANINNHTPDPPGGYIARDPATNEPTGYLRETARFLIRNAEPPPTAAQHKAHLNAALDMLTAQSIVEAHDMFATADLARLLLDLDQQRQIHHTIWLYAVPEDLPALQALMRDRTRDGRTSESGRVVLAGLKLFLDGTLNARTASMLAPFADPIAEHPRGTPLFTNNQLIQHFQSARDANLAIAVHAIGDAAVRQALDCWQAVLASNRRNPERCASLSLPPFRIEHAQFIAPDDIPRFASLSVVASVQPCHLLPDMEALHRLTPHALDRAFPLRDLIAAAEARSIDPASLIWLGSDAPVVPPHPSDNIQAATHRRRADADPSQTINPDQRITTEQTLALSRPTPMAT